MEHNSKAPKKRGRPPKYASTEERRQQDAKRKRIQRQKARANTEVPSGESEPLPRMPLFDPVTVDDAVSAGADDEHLMPREADLTQQPSERQEQKTASIPSFQHDTMLALVDDPVPITEDDLIEPFLPHDSLFETSTGEGLLDDDDDGARLPALSPTREHWNPGSSHNGRAFQATCPSTPRLDCSLLDCSTPRGIGYLPLILY
jgi:hypothetical protein